MATCANDDDDCHTSGDVEYSQALLTFASDRHQEKCYSDEGLHRSLGEQHSQLDEKQAEERQSALRRFNHHREMADQQIQTIMESMLTLKEVDLEMANSFFVDSSDKTTEREFQEVLFRTLSILV